MRNIPKVSHLMDFGGTKTLMCPKPKKQTPRKTLIETLGG
jgi:trehalose-6-phosphatase